MIKKDSDSQMNRSIFQSMDIIDLDINRKTAVIEDSENDCYYSVSLRSCSCPYFQKTHNTCEHMRKLQYALSESSKADAKINPEVTVFLKDRPGHLPLVSGILFFGFALFMTRHSAIVSIFIFLISMCFFYKYFRSMQSPDDSIYITADQSERWQELLIFEKEIEPDAISSSGHFKKMTSSELEKISIPFLILLKNNAEKYAAKIVFADTIEEVDACGEKLISTQTRILELSEFIVIDNDKPKDQLDKYKELIETRRKMFSHK